MRVTWDCTGRDVLESALNLFDQQPKGRIVINPALDQINGMDHRRMVAAEMLANAGKRVAGDLTTEIHRYLPAEGDMLGAFLRFEVRQLNMERILNDPLNRFDAGFAFISRN